MKKSYSFSMIASRKLFPRVMGAALVLCAGAVCQLSAQVTVSLVNPGFEDPSVPANSKPNGWTGIVTDNASFTWVTGTAGNEVYTGTHAYAINSPDVGSTQARIQQVNAARFDVSVGAEYTLSLWAKGTDLDLAEDQFKLTIEWWNAAGSGLTGTSSSAAQTFTANDTWQEFTITSSAAPEGTASGKILLNFIHGDGSISTAPLMTFDDLSMTSSIPEASTSTALMGLSALLAIFIIRRLKLFH